MLTNMLESDVFKELRKILRQSQPKSWHYVKKNEAQEKKTIFLLKKPCSLLSFMLVSKKCNTP